MTSRAPSRRAFRRVSAAAILSTGILAQVQAQAGTTHAKTSTGTDVWSTATWSNGVPNAVGDIASYAVNTNSNTTLDINVTIGQLVKTSNKTWNIVAGAGTFTLDNTSNVSLNLFGGGTGNLAAITTNGTNSSQSLTVSPNIIIGNSGPAASGLVIGTVASGVTVSPGAVVIGGTINGTGGLYLANASGTGGVNTATVTLNGAINNTGLINVGQYESGSAIQTGTGTTTFGGAIGSNVTGFTNVGAGSVVFNAPVTLTGNMVFNGTGATTVSSNASGTLNNSGTITNSGATTGTTSLVGGVGSNVTSLNLTSATSAFNVGGTLTVNSGGTTLNNTSTAKALTVSAAVNGAGNLISFANSTGGITLSGAINNTGNLTVSGTGTGASAVSGSIGSNVGTVLFNQTGNLTVSSATISNTGNVTFAGQGASVATVSGTTLNSTGNLTFSGTGTSSVSVATANINITGAILNNGSTTGVTTIGTANTTGVIASTVTSVTQDSTTSRLDLGANNAGYLNGIYINSGSLLGKTSANALGANTNNVYLGNFAPGSTADATLIGNFGGTNLQPILLSPNTTGTLTITSPNNGTPQVFGGGVTGTHDLVVAGTSTQGIRFSTAAVNNTGSLTANATGTGAAQVDIVGTNVTSITQNGTGGFTIGQGANTLNLNGGRTLTSLNSGLFSVVGGVSGSGNLTLNANSTGGFTFSTVAVNNTGNIAISGTGTNTVTFSTSIGNQVGNVTLSDANATLLLNSANTFTGNLVINVGKVSLGAASATSTSPILLGSTGGGAASLTTTVAQTIANDITLATNAVGPLTIGGGASTTTTYSSAKTITLNGNNLNLAAAGTGALAISGTLAGGGSLTNVGTGAGTTTINSLLDTTITSVTQNSPTSMLVLSNSLNSFTGGTFINAGTVQGGAAASGATTFGAGSIFLGSSTGSPTANATVNFQGSFATFANPIVLGTTTGVLTVNNANSGTVNTLTGGITGPNNVVITASSGNGTGGIVFNTNAVNNTGTVTNSTTGTGAITFNSGIGSNVTGVTQNSATSAVNLNATSPYSGPTNINAGTFNVAAGVNLGGTAISAATGTTLNFLGNTTLGTSGSASLAVSDSNILSLVGGSLSTLNINSATPGATVLTFGGSTGSTLNLELGGSTSDSIVLGSGLKASVGAGVVTVNTTVISGLNSGSRTLISAPGGGLDTGGGFSLNTASGNFGGNSLSLTNTGTALLLNASPNAAADTLYFTGAIDNTFDTFTGGSANNSNFSTDAAGTVDAHAAPASNTSLHFTATSLASAVRTVTLGHDQSIRNLFIDSQVANALTLASGGAGTASLTITPANSANGITVNSSIGGTLAITAPIVLGATQTFTNNSPNAVTLSGAITGTANLTVNSTSNGTQTISGSINNTGSIVNSGTGSGTTSFNGAIGSNVTTLTQNGTSFTSLGGTAANTYTGLTTITSGNINLTKTAGVTAIPGNVLINGGRLTFSTNDQIADTASVTVTSGFFNANGTVNTGLASLNETIASLSVSGTGIYNGSNSNASTGIVVTGAASFAGGSGAAYFAGSGGLFSANSLTVSDMTRTTESAAPDNTTVTNGFALFGNTATRQAVVTVGSGGLTLTANTAGGNNILLRTGNGAGVKGSKLALDGDVTTTGSFGSAILNDTTAGTNLVGSTSVDLAATGTGAVTRNFNVGAGGLTIAVPVANGTSSAATLNKLGSGTLNLDRANLATTDFGSYTGATTVNGGTLRASAAGVMATTSSITINNSGSLLLGASLLGGAATTDRINDAAPVAVNNGGKLGYASTSPTATSGQSETLGTLTLSSGSTLDFGTGNTNTLTFGGLTSVSGLTLQITGWSGATYLATDSADSGLSTQDRFLFAAASDPGYTDAQLSGISFYNDSGTFLGTGHQVLFSPGVYEFVPVAIPEPSTIFSAIFAVGLVGFRERRRLGRLVRKS